MLKRGLHKLRIFTYPINTYEDISFDDIRQVAVVEGDDIGEIIMLKIRDIYLKKILIRAKDKIDFIQGKIVGFNNRLNP
jgi:hypothetical protein